MRSQRRALLLAFASSTTLLAGQSAAQPVEVTKHYCDFAAADFDATPGHIEVNGDAAGTPGKLVLTPDEVKKTGTAFYHDPLDLDPSHELHVYFKAQMQPKMEGGNGLSFMIQNNSPGSVGANLDGLGFGGIMPSVIFEFDTSVDPFPPPSPFVPPYIAMILDGDQSVHHSVAISLGQTGLVTPAFIHFWVDYDSAKHFRLFVANEPVKPAAPLDWFTVADDPPSALDLVTRLTKNGVTQGFVGFTAATGATPDETNFHDILAWEMSNEGVPCKCQGDPACAALETTPVCSLVQPGGEALCVECTSADDSHCPATKPVCHPTAEVCVECNTTADCPADTPVCDPVAHACGGCTTDADCQDRPDRPHCETMDGPNKGKCEPCLLPEHCQAEAPICDKVPDPYECRPCVTDKECQARDPALPYCADAGPKEGQCEPCTEDAHCLVLLKPICDQTLEPTSACRPCQKDSECQARDPIHPYCSREGADEGSCVDVCDGACCGVACNCGTGKCCTDADTCPPCEDKACNCATGQCCSPADQATCCQDRPCDCATLACCDDAERAVCAGTEVVGGGCACSTPGGDRTGTVLGLAAALAALGGLARRRRR